ncbi:CDP-diacylglycerol--glycerol-3-phosphate 3-phosphatidyltransferase [Candidatus Termititenax persephonae]|uniref:CDP-diacylglycerol--glycerol-3-phosphate 3-phosphatidyltransferase n=1 Tax=Candidatus Termititenax persephonae TaxID=2218525 RepID=A0A388TI22_9BACT|nr:CDP-diacylglycerol--glycerol-3-phosphate 3-phosphatidyltransferase [Candidatus Termititenax persephonae]
MNYALGLTLLRVLFVPVVILLLYLPVPGLVPALVFALLSLTDWLDGYVARKYGQGTELGKFLDPLADKILVLSVLVALAVQLRVEVFSVLALLIRELAVMGLRCAVLERDGAVVAASKLAKWKTAVQMLAIFLLLLNVPQLPLVKEIYYLSVVLAIVSGLEYFRDNRSCLK